MNECVTTKDFTSIVFSHEGLKYWLILIAVTTIIFILIWRIYKYERNNRTAKELS